jgi:hypothetical protein
MWSEQQTLTTPGPDITFNSGSGDQYILIPAMCRWAQDLRVTSEPVPRGHGAIVFPVLRGGGHLYLGGLLYPSTDTAAARDAMHYNLESAMTSLTGGGTGTYAQPSGRGNLVVVAESMPESAGWNGEFRKTFALVLHSAAGWA